MMPPRSARTIGGSDLLAPEGGKSSDRSNPSSPWLRACNISKVSSVLFWNCSVDSAVVMTVHLIHESVSVTGQ